MKYCPSFAARVAGLAASVMMPFVALAEVPPALDRVPAEAPIMVSMRSVSGFVTNMESFLKTLPPDAMKDFQKIKDVLKTPGVNADGSAAIAVMSVDHAESEKAPVVAIIPVKDYAAFVKAFGGTGTGVEELTIEGEKQFVKSLDGGFAALSMKKDIVEKFAGKAGSGAAIEKMLGANGKTVSDGKDAVIIANLPVLAPKIKEGMKGAKEQMKQMAQMGGGGEKAGEANVAMVEWLEKGITEDGQAGVMGVKMGEKGITLDLAGQFKEGSEWASYFTGKGKGGALVGAMPNEAFLFAFAIDAASPGLKKMLGAVNALQAKAGGGVFGGMNPMAMVEKADAMGFFLGESPAPIGGLFLNTAYFMRTSDGAGVAKTMKDTFTAMNGKEEGGVRFTTSYNEGGDKVEGKAVDTWSMKMAGDQAAQLQAMLFGPNGLQGYVAQADGGVVVTYARNKDILAKSTAAFKSGTGLSSDKGVALVGAELPKGRTMEGYIGVKSILNTVSGFMGMMGGGANFTVPEDIAPVGFGGTTDQGGVRVAIYVPSTVIKAFADLSKQMKGGEGEENMNEGKGEGEPKF